MTVQKSSGFKPWAFRFLLTLSVFGAALGVTLGWPSPVWSDSPGAKSGDGSRALKVAYFEAGPYRDYLMTFLGLAIGLEEVGLIRSGRPPVSQSESSKAVWEWLAGSAGGESLLFLPDGFYSAGWDESKVAELRDLILKRAKDSEIDLILAFGTAAGKALAGAGLETPVMSIAATDPVSAGISLSAERSGHDYLHVQVESGKIERQLAMFHNIFGFRTLGVPYDLSPEGRLAMGVPSIERAAAELGFEILPCQVSLGTPDQETAVRNLTYCVESLSQKSEAIYLTISKGMAEERMAEILAPAIAGRIPTFSQRGPAETRLGVLMSLAEPDFQASGRFEAEGVRRIVSGQKPGDIPQIYLAPLTMALNINTAMAIGWDPPFEVLAAVDELCAANPTPPRLLAPAVAPEAARSDD
jgi:ABC-type uncharacterized transport system substrate-binding protein